MDIRSLTTVLRARLNRWRFQRALPCIRGSAPMVAGRMPFTLLSMVHHRDVDAYLVAAKSFGRFVTPRRVVVVLDPSITADDRRVMQAHIPGVDFIRAEDCRDPELPQGGCWERLTAIADLVRNEYVVQLDADTVSLADMPEIRNCIEEGHSFLLATEDGQDFDSCAACAAWARAQFTGKQHVQGLAECHLDTLPGAATKRYVRGCAGFSGFAPGSFDRDALRQLSSHMSHALGQRWSAWGTEQFASNYMVANSPSARVLPHPKYCHPGREAAETVFLHFIGYVRFASPRYSMAVKRVCSELGAM